MTIFISTARCPAKAELDGWFPPPHKPPRCKVRERGPTAAAPATVAGEFSSKGVRREPDRLLKVTEVSKPWEDGRKR